MDKTLSENQLISMEKLWHRVEKTTAPSIFIGPASEDVVDQAFFCYNNMMNIIETVEKCTFLIQVLLHQ